MKVSKKPKAIDTPASQETSHTLGIISSLFTNLASESPARVRLLAKFVENNYEKVDKLLEIRETAQVRLMSVEADIEQEKKVRYENFLLVIRAHIYVAVPPGFDRRWRTAGRGRRGFMVSATFGRRAVYIANGGLY
jgi:hypothetical protein